MQELKANWIVHEGGIYALAVSSDGKYVASASGDTARVSDMRGNEIGSYMANDVLNDVKFTPDQHHLILASTDKIISIVDWRTGSLFENCLGHADSCYAVDVLPVSGLILSASLDNTVKVWCSNGTVKTFTGHEVRARLMLTVQC